MDVDKNLDVKGISTEASPVTQSFEEMVSSAVSPTVLGQLLIDARLRFDGSRKLQNNFETYSKEKTLVLKRIIGLYSKDGEFMSTAAFRAAGDDELASESLKEFTGAILDAADLYEKTHDTETD